MRVCVIKKRAQYVFVDGGGTFLKVFLWFLFGPGTRSTRLREGEDRSSNHLLHHTVHLHVHHIDTLSSFPEKEKKKDDILLQAIAREKSVRIAAV